jgi:hypothetical protein
VTDSFCPSTTAAHGGVAEETGDWAVAAVRVLLGEGNAGSRGKAGGSAAATGARDIDIDNWPPLSAESEVLPIVRPRVFPRTRLRAAGACRACSSCGSRACAIDETPDRGVPCAGEMGVSSFSTSYKEQWRNGTGARGDAVPVIIPSSFR